MPDDIGPRRYPSSQRWGTFVRNHAQAILACDFFVIVTASLRVLYVIVEVGTRRITHFNVTAHPTAGEVRCSEYYSLRESTKTALFIIEECA
jgi:hypothetical protein